MPLESEKKQSSNVKSFAAGLLSLILLIVFVAGGTQVLISPKRVTAWLEKAFEKENIPAHIDFEAAQMSFTGSLWPIFGVRLRNFEVALPRGHQKISFESPYILIPLSLRSLLGDKKFDLGTIRTHELRMKPGIATSSSEEFVDETLLSLWKMFQQGQSVGKSFKGLYVGDLYFDINAERSLNFKNWRFDPNEAEIRFDKLYLELVDSEPEILLETVVCFPKEVSNDRSNLVMAIGKFHMNFEKEDEGYLISGLQGEADLKEALEGKSFKFTFKGHLKTVSPQKKVKGYLSWKDSKKFETQIYEDYMGEWKQFANYSTNIPLAKLRAEAKIEEEPHSSGH